ncbi:MAG: hypothetical protein LBS65_02615 [Desulfovibrio sp.]|nr:hypothetical protein [Desulfovibrio sp.]
MPKFMSAEEAVSVIKDDDVLVTEAFMGNGQPEVLYKALEKRFLETKHPAKLTLMHVSGQGNGRASQSNRLAHDGFLHRVIGAHYNVSPQIMKIIAENKIAAYNFPQGVMAQMMREIAGGKLGVFTHVGLKTFVDPRIEGGKLNEKAKAEDLVSFMTIEGKEQLFFKAVPINVCFLRGTYADEKGNISMDKEPLLLETRSIAQATKNSGGIVIVQVEQKVKAGTIHPKDVVIPGICVDIVVTVPEIAEHMPEHVAVTPSLAGNIRIPESGASLMEFSERKIIGRRGAMLLQPDSVVNLGIGVPEAVAAVANEEGIGKFFTLTMESGQIGGIPQLGERFGTSLNPEAIIQQPEQFDFYDGGGLDIAFLGLAETDQFGNINVSKLPTRVPGCGGFIDITQNTKTVVFMGTFTAKGLEIESGDGTLKIKKEGTVKKFVSKVQQITFSGDYARETGQTIYYMTERAIFELKQDGMHLTEIAPGIDIDKHILPYMDFVPKMTMPVKTMDKRLFVDALMGLSNDR